jgi:uncharacterized membrane protein
MSDLFLLILAVGLFVGGHELLSHPLRAPLVARLGEKGFLLLYSVVALGSLFWAVELWKVTPPERLWLAPAAAGLVAPVLMLIAFILFVGSVTAPNPALMGGGVPGKPGVRGVQAITRHPMMWAFALWAMVHVLLAGSARTLVLAGGILMLALFGSAMQDRKKLRQNPGYAAHMAATGFVPLAAQLSGRQPWHSLWPGAVPVLGGLLLWAAMLWAHPLLIGLPALR